METIEAKNPAVIIIEVAAADLGVDPRARDSQAQIVGWLAGMVVRLRDETAQLKRERDGLIRDKKDLRSGIAEAILKLQETACL